MERESRPFKTGMLVVKSSNYALIDSKIKELSTRFQFSSE